MIKRIYKRIKTVVDSISVAQKLIAFLAWLLTISLAGNIYQQGIITEKATPSVAACTNTHTKEVVERIKPVPQPPQIIEKTTIIKDCHESVIKHEKGWHRT